MELSPIKKALLALKQMQSKLDALEQAKHEPIAVVGMGCRFPGANNPEEFWQLLQEGRDGIIPTPRERWELEDYSPSKLYPTQGGFVPHLKEFDPSFFRIAPRETASIDPQQRLLLEVGWEALENAAIAPERIQGSQTGVFVGIAAVDYWHQLLSRRQTEIDAYLTTGNTHSLASGRISHFFDFRGTSISLDTACSSSLVAVHLAIKSLREHECHLALAGGVNRLISPKISINFAQAKMLAPDGRCKTFDESANGFVRSEGCGVVVLKRLSDAIADQDRIRAVLLGSATNQDGRTSSITTPSSLSQQAVIEQALINSKVTADQVSYVETHGTGTSLGDAIELEALSQVFKNNEELVLGAVKTNIGHLESAAGIASLIKTVLALENNLIPSNLHLKQANTKVDWQHLPFKLPDQAIAWEKKAELRIAGISSFGFSGTNAHLLVQEADTSAQKKQDQLRNLQSLYLFTLSARSKKALKQLATKHLDYLNSHSDLLIEDICFTVNVGRSHFSHRVAMTVTSLADLQTQLTQYTTQESSPAIYQGRANLNQEPKLACEFELEHHELKELIEAIVDSQIIAKDLADIIWQVSREGKSPSQQQKTVYSLVKSGVGSWQLLIKGIAQLYVLGVKIDWKQLGNKSGGNKISLPTYPFQRAVYWFE